MSPADSCPSWPPSPSGQRDPIAARMPQRAAQVLHPCSRVASSTQVLVLRRLPSCGCPLNGHEQECVWEPSNGQSETFPPENSELNSCPDEARGWTEAHLVGWLAEGASEWEMHGPSSLSCIYEFPLFQAHSPLDENLSPPALCLHFLPALVICHLI